MLKQNSNNYSLKQIVFLPLSRLDVLKILLAIFQSLFQWADLVVLLSLPRLPIGTALSIS
jgi:hypothetical protein